VPNRSATEVVKYTTMKTLTVCLLVLLPLWEGAISPLGASRYQPLLATSAGRDSLARLALWEDGRVTGDGRLFAYLGSDNPLIRLRAVEVIGRIQDPQDVPHLTPMLYDPDPRVVREAVFALGQIGSEEAIPELVRAGDKSTPEMQPLFAEAFGKIGGEDAVIELMDMLHAFQGRVRAGAAISMANIDDPSATNALLVSIHDNDAKVAWRAIYALEKSKTKRVRQSVIPFLSNEDPRVRAFAARTLGKQRAQDAVEYLVMNVADPDPRVSINSINALASILKDKKDKNVVNYLGGAIEKSESHHFKKAAVIAIGDIGHKAGKDYLAQTILDAYPGIRAESYRALARILGKNSLLFVSGGLNDSDPVVRAAAIEAVGVSGEEKRIPDLIAVIDGKDDPRMRAAAVRGLSNFDTDEVKAALEAALADGDWVVETEAAAALGKIGDKKSLPALISRFSMRSDRVDTDIRLEIMRSLAEMKAKEAQPLAVEALQASDPRLRRAAVEFFENTGLEMPELQNDRYFYERDFDPSRRAELSLPLGTRRAIIRTERGDIEIELFGDDAIQTVASFISLATSGFYENSTFHRVVPNFVIQGGCPRGDGWGDPGYYIRSEFNRYRYDRGMVGIAHSGKDTGGSQFFITHSAQPHLNGRYTIFGRVTKGMDVVDQIAQGDRFNVIIVE
jgi:cyclophilin family peptidyl-prolyl cis-trans isomerase